MGEFSRREGSYSELFLARLSPSAALGLAERLADENRPAAAFRLFARAARAGVAEAQHRVGRCYLEATGVPPSVTEGVRWLERAAGQGHVAAQVRLAGLHIQGLARRAPSGSAAPALFQHPEPAEADFAAAERWALVRRPAAERACFESAV